MLKNKIFFILLIISAIIGKSKNEKKQEFKPQEKNCYLTKNTPVNVSIF